MVLQGIVEAPVEQRSQKELEGKAEETRGISQEIKNGRPKTIINTTPFPTIRIDRAYQNNQLWSGISWAEGQLCTTNRLRISNL